MGKFIFFLIVIGAIYFLFFKKTKHSDKISTDEEFLMCEKCKTFMPKSKIKQIGNKNICEECYDNT